MATGVEGSGEYHLAQVNTPRLLAPLDSLVMVDFVALIEEVNAAADVSPGFVWRQEHPSLTEAHTIFGDKNLIVNLSVWTDVRALMNYFKNPIHAQAFRRRREWFEQPQKGGRATLALWWIEAGHLPTISEAEERLMYLTSHGLTQYAFDFRNAGQFPVKAFDLPMG